VSEEAITQEQMEAFVEKLNGFMATISEQEQRWLASLVTSADGNQSVQGYLFTAPISLTVVPSRPASGPAVKPKGGDQPIKYLEFQLKDAYISQPAALN
jgi:hypothetical protein